ncbi:MAG: GlsB/YeaQ/YmgE family stress response membrane protein [Planctomycetaceae bacterium]|nr:GlsB/YeaQ/YmgE family stress response membrane protein [Planctomycetaceae bacterium]
MWLIQYAIFGLIAGAIARMLHPGRDPMNWVWTMLLGIGGAVVGGWIGGQLLGINTDRGLMSWVAAIGGSVLLLAAYNALTARRAAVSGPTTSDDYKKAVFDDLSRGPNR